MPIITDIKRQKRSEGRFNVFMDGKYRFALGDLDLSTSGLRVGQELSEAQIEAFLKEGEEAKAYNRAIKYLNYRPRSEREVLDYLAKKGYDPELAQMVLERLERIGLVNDQAFAASWIANRQALRPRSRQVLAQELAAKGVSRDVAAAALGELGEEIELESLVGVVQRKRRLPQYREADKLMGYLARQGYRYELIKKALERLDGELD